MLQPQKASIQIVSLREKQCLILLKGVQQSMIKKSFIIPPDLARHTCHFLLIPSLSLCLTSPPSIVSVLFKSGSFSFCVALAVLAGALFRIRHVSLTLFHSQIFHMLLVK